MDRKLKAVLLRAYFLLDGQLGIDPRRSLRSLRGLPRYLRDLSQFTADYRGPLKISPCLQDWDEEGGATKSEYFWQDLLAARKIFDAKPRKHVDVGSRIDGFVAHVAAFRQIEVFDIRPITTTIPGMTFTQADLMSPVAGVTDYCDSLSCLHALEHFGLGRYGDPIDPRGFERGLSNMARMLEPRGRFYLSVPIGVERVEFNSHRVFDPHVIVEAAGRFDLRMTAITVIHPDGGVSERGVADADLDALARQPYALGLFTFEKHRGLDG